MSTHAAQRRRARSRVRARRRTAGAVLGLALLILLGAAVLPSLKHAARELTLPMRHEEIIREQAREKGVPADLIAGVIYAESKFSDQTSHAGARGLMQVTPATARAIALRTGGTAFREDDLSDPDVNIRYGTWYLRNLLDRYGENVMLALAAYNAGQGNVDQWIAREQQAGRSLTIDAIPFAETRAYVQRVLDAREDYRRTYARELGL